MSLTPPISDLDTLHLTRALSLASEAQAFASPNPTVGCVLTHNATTIGEGAHLYDLRDHAEIAALKQAASQHHSTLGATAYVTLEPCSHHGRTGPCADALIAAGISRCVIATLDPNPLVSGRGLAKLRAAHIETLVLPSTHPLALRARRLNDAFAFAIQHHRPFVTLKAALSVDGNLAPNPATRTSGSPHWLTGPAARADVQLLRHASDAILTGINTILADNPSLTDRTQLPRRRPLLRVVLDSYLRTPLTAKLLHPVQNDVLIVCTEDAPQSAEDALRSAGADVLRLPSTSSNNPSPSALLHNLAQRQINSVLLEAGSHINGAFLRDHLVDRAILYFAEHELGPDAIPFAADYPSPYVLQQRLTSLTRDTFPSTPPGATQSSEDIRITGYLHDPWSNTPPNP
jgi:diaminohydroxyphosphoribosylaminopyrimidine deaminase/5-amino-6-(5-phosphoribosylamino)uracil reductase